MAEQKNGLEGYFVTKGSKKLRYGYTTGSILNISEVTVLADYFIIASGSNRNQVQAMADNVEETLGKLGHEPKQIEGYQSGNWILMDYQDVIVHIFDNENRLFYDLERIWRDGKSLTVEEL